MPDVEWALSNPNTWPPGLWGLAGSLIGGFFSSFGAFLSYRSNIRKLNSDRVLALRRELFLAAADEFTKASEFINGALDREPTENPFAGLGGVQALNAKVQLVAEEETAVKVSNLAMRLFEDRLQLAIPERHFREATERVTALETAVERHRRNVDKIVDTVPHPLPSLPLSAEASAAIEPITRAFAEEMQRLAAAEESLASWKRILEQARAEFQSLQVSLAHQRSPLTFDVLIALRTDLGLRTRRNNYVRDVQAQGDRFMTAVEKVVADFKVEAAAAGVRAKPTEAPSDPGR